MDNPTAPPIRAYVNGNPVDVPTGGSALDAVAAFDAAVAEQVRRGERAITDSRGIVTSPDGAAYGGAIYRIVRGGAREDAA